MIVREAFPRVTLPGTDEETRASIEAVQETFREHDEHRAHLRKEQKGLAAAMVRLGKPIARRTRPKARTTAHVRHMARMRARAAFVS